MVNFRSTKNYLKEIEKHSLEKTKKSTILKNEH